MPISPGALPVGFLQVATPNKQEVLIRHQGTSTTSLPVSQECMLLLKAVLSHLEVSGSPVMYQGTQL